MRQFLLFFAMLMFGASTLADEPRRYNPRFAVWYAVTHHQTSYGSAPDQNPFRDYDNLDSNGNLIDCGNCTNFVSQVIIAGLSKKLRMDRVFDERWNFDIDATGNYSLQWYWRSDSDRGPAFTGAHQMFQYADQNLPTYRGLHFRYITHDTATAWMDVMLVWYGDVIFADWDADGHIDHSMIVTSVDQSRTDYNRIRLTYQGTTGIGKTDIGLGDLNDDYNQQALFYVYRPKNYNPDGL